MTVKASHRMLMNGALDGIRILDLTRVLAGPWCTQTLADLGAEVIKVERPEIGDDTRHWGPPFLRDRAGEPTEQATYYACCNRNKRSVTIDLASHDGQTIVQKMATESDVVVENFKVGGLKPYGLDYESLRELNPRLIYCSITGFGQTGPYSKRAGYDLVAQAMSGMMSITGHADEEVGSRPLRAGVAITDLFAGLYAATGILAAVQARHSTGIGQHIDISLLDVGMAMLANQGVGYLNTGDVPQRQGNSHPSLAPYQDFQTSDGSMLLAIGNDGQFSRFCETVQHSEWATDPRYETNTRRVANRVELVALIAEVMRTRRTHEWIKLFESRAVPSGPINSIDEAFADPHVLDRCIAVKMRRDAGDGVGVISSIANPIRLSENPPRLTIAPPTLGQHTVEVLEEFGIDGNEHRRLRSLGIV